MVQHDDWHHIYKKHKWWKARICSEYIVLKEHQRKTSYTSIWPLQIYKHLCNVEVYGHNFFFHKFIIICPPNTLGIYTCIWRAKWEKEGRFSVSTQSLSTCTWHNTMSSAQPLYMTLANPPGSKKTKRSGTSSSTHVHHLYTSHSLGGRTSLRQEVLNASAIRKRQAKDRTDHGLRQDAMSTVERDELEAIRTNMTNDSGSGSVDNSTLSMMPGKWMSMLFLLERKP